VDYEKKSACAYSNQVCLNLSENEFFFWLDKVDAKSKAVALS
jgi:hypothetical protein